MAIKRTTAHHGDFARTFASEDGRHYRGYHQDMGAVQKHVERIRHMHEYRDPHKDTMFDRHVGSVSPAVLMGWLKQHNYTLQQWAVNAGGDPYRKFKGGPGVYDKFLTYDLSREFSKLHNDHVTTKRESSQIYIPEHIRRKNGIKHETDSGSGDSGLVEPRGSVDHQQNAGLHHTGGDTDI